MADPNTRQGKRTPVTLKIKFKSETLEQFIERYAVDVSQGGIFIRTKEPLAVGTQMKFEFQLRDASPLIAGEGTVVWTRENDPSRPAIAPGMGVRFDRLADGSQAVLERILAEKAKQAPGRAHTETAPKQAMFTDTPTKVAPAPVQDALGLRSRRDSEQTPLPKPMPFHSDADEFDEKAFEEATKVRSLEELAAQTAGLDTEDDALPGDAGTAIMPADELAERRKAGRPDSSPPPVAESAEESPPAARAVPDRDSAPGLPSPPVVEPTRPPRMLDTTPSPRREPELEPAVAQTPSESARTKPGVEPAKAATAAKADSAVPRAVAAEPSLPAAPQRPSSAPIVIGILVAAAAAIGAVWWFVLRDQVAETLADNTEQTTPADTVATDPGSAGSAVAVAQTETGSGSADPTTGSADPAAGSGDGSGSAEPAESDGPTADTVIAASVKKGATVEVLGTDIKGPAPLTAQLATDKIFKIRVTAPGYAPTELQVKGGEKATAKLALKPRILSVTSDPPGADILIDGVNTRQLTPAEVTLTPGQAARARVRVTLRRPGFKQADQIVQASAFKEEHGRMTHAIEAKLATYVRPTGGTQAGTQTPTPAGGGEDGEGSDSAGAGNGSATPPAGSGTPAGGTQPPPAGGTQAPPASGTPTPPANGTPAPPTGGTPPAGTGSASAPTTGGTTSGGTAEPEPAWTK